MSTAYEAKHIKIRALHDHVIISDMNFGENKTAAGIVLRSDNAKSHGVHPRWGKVYCVGPEQNEIQVGQWILIEHGRWTRGIKINDGDSEKTIQRVDLNGILAVSDEEPSAEDLIIGDSI
jgi:co-chaperonin GroES (HSP10)